MIKLTVQTYNGAPLPQALSAQFDELGGSIGRADNNQLVLPDPERSISRVHAQIVYRNGGYALVDRGSNPVLVNGRPLGNGVEAPIKAGDQLQVGGYMMRVDASSHAGGGAGMGGGASSDPFGDLGGMAFAAPSSPAMPAIPQTRPVAGASVDPLAAFGGPSSGGGSDPFGFGGGFGAPAASPAFAPSSSSSSLSHGGGIPDDWDPFAPDPVTPPKPQDLARSLGQSNSLGLELGGGATTPLIPGMGDLGGGKANTSSSIDALFSLGSTGGADPFANSVLAQAAMQPNMANHIDPMKSLNSVSVGSGTAAPDNVSALNQPFMEAPMKVSPPKAPAASAASSTAASAAPTAAPTATPPTGIPAAPPPVMPRPPIGAKVGGAAVMSWDEGAQENRTVIRPKAPPAGSAGGPRIGDFDSWGTASMPVSQAAPGSPHNPAALDSSLDPLALLGGGGDGRSPMLDPLAMMGGSGLGSGSVGSGSGPSVFDPLAFGEGPAEAAGSMPSAPTASRSAQPTRSIPPAPTAAATSAMPPAPTAAMTSRPAIPPASSHAATPQAQAPISEGTPADQAALINALREGLGMPALPIQSLTPELMKLLGQLLHEATRGTVDLLVARAALKREIRAEVTMIVAKENNPLKFSPSAEVALSHLLSPPARGFMPAAPAMRDAYDDLRAHQFAFVAGMRAALEGVLKRFDPSVLESKLTQKSVLSTLLPASRKAKMWDVFQDLYGQISAEASDDFHELFGREFLRAYEQHIDQLQNDA